MWGRVRDLRDIYRIFDFFPKMPPKQTVMWLLEGANLYFFQIFYIFNYKMTRMVQTGIETGGSGFTKLKIGTESCLADSDWVWN